MSNSAATGEVQGPQGIQGIAGSAGAAGSPGAPGATAVTASFSITSTPWVCGAIAFSVTSVGTDGPTLPAVETDAVQGPLIVTTNTRFSNNTDPYGAVNNAGPNAVGQIYPTGRN